MITEAIFNGLFGAADFLLGLIPEMEWTINTTVWQYAHDILSMICYLLPMGYITPAIIFIIGLSLFRIAVAALRGLLDLIPGY